MSSSIPDKFTFPFCYTPHPLVIEASQRLISRVDAEPSLREAFAEGKMLGVMVVMSPDGSLGDLYSFSGFAGGRSVIEGFVPPIFDLLSSDYPRREAEITAINRRIRECGDPQGCLSVRRKEMSEALQDWIFSKYVVCNFEGGKASIKSVFASQGLVPPSGTGDCAAPKLLQYACLNGLRPLAMGELWYGRSKGEEVRSHGCFYPSCKGKCGPLLPFMMRGLDVEANPLEDDTLWSYGEPSIVYCDDAVVVADKPSGMLCVPGRTGRESLLSWLDGRLGRRVYEVHRLDMDTSGLLVSALSHEAQVSLRRQFEQRLVDKRYEARLCASTSAADLPGHGFVRLPLMPDYYERPRQMVSYEGGKTAVTEYRVIRPLEDGRVDVEFVPHTGRTHQLRVHAASSLGLGRPICGDRLYGGGSGTLMLRAVYIRFNHPVTGKTMEFTL